MERISCFTVPLEFEVHTDLDLISDIGRHDLDHDGSREATSNPISDVKRPEEPCVVVTEDVSVPIHSRLLDVS